MISKDFFPRVRGLFRTNDSTLMKRNGSTAQHPKRMTFHTVFTIRFIKYTVISYVTIAPSKYNRQRHCVSAKSLCNSNVGSILV
jgi:hypothetical protein